MDRWGRTEHNLSLQVEGQRKALHVSQEDEMNDRLRLAGRSPLALPITTMKEQIDLFDRGFLSCYKVRLDLDPRGGPIAQAAFGTLGDERNSDEFEFSIRGLPPLEGTRVWITGSQRHRTAQAYQTQMAAVIDGETGNPNVGLGLLNDSMEDRDERWPLAVDSLRQTGLYDDGGYDLWFLLEVVLP